MYCIYRITNCINGKTYIGQHKYKETPYDSYMGSGKHLRRAQKKYGIENFKKDILVFCIIDKKLIDMMEKEYIALERKCNTNGCYNIADGGEGRTAPWSEESKRKNSEAHKGKKPWNAGTHLSSKGMKGKHHSEETRKKMSEAKKRNKPWNAGKHWKLVEGKRVYF